METDLVQLTCEAHPAESFTGFCPSCLRDRLHFLESASAATSTAHRNSISTTHRNSTSTASQLRRCKSFSYAAASNEIFAVDRRDRQFENEVELRPVKDHADPESQSKKPNFWKKLQNWRENKKTKKTKKKQQQEDLTAGESSRRFVDTQPEVSVDGFSRRSCDLGPRFSLDAGRIPFDEPRLSLDIRSVRSRFHAPVPAIQRSDGQIPVEEDLMVPGSSKQTKNYYYDSSSSRSRRRSLDRSNSVKKFNIEMNEPKTASSARVLPAVRSESFRHASSDAFVGDPSDSFREKKSKKWSIWGLIHRQSTSSRGGGDNVDCLRVNEYNSGYNNGRVSRSNGNVSLRRSCDYGHGGFGSMRKKGLGLERNGSLRDNNGYHLFTRS